MCSVQSAQCKGETGTNVHPAASPGHMTQPRIRYVWIFSQIGNVGDFEIYSRMENTEYFIQMDIFGHSFSYFVYSQILKIQHI